MDGGRAHACALSPVMRPTDTERGTGEMGVAMRMCSEALLVRLHGTKNSLQQFASRTDCRAVCPGRSSWRHLVTEELGG